MSKVIFKNATHIYMQDTKLERVAIKNISINFEEGIWHTIIGHTGSGKSTLIQHINGLLKATYGEVITSGYLIKKTSLAQQELLKIRKNNSIVFQFPELQLFSETIEKEIMFGPRNFGVSEEEAKSLAKKYIKLVGLTEDFLQKSPFELSGGQKRRVAIASILAIQPEVLVIDEPTAGLDPAGKKEIMEIFKKLHKEGMTIILVTHNMDDVWKYSDVVTLLNRGQVAFSGTPETLFDNEEFLSLNSIAMPKHIGFIKKIKKITGINVPFHFNEAKQIVEYIKTAKGGK